MTCSFCKWNNTGTVQVNKAGDPPTFICPQCMRLKLAELERLLEEKGRLCIKVMDQRDKLAAVKAALELPL